MRVWLVRSAWMLGVAVAALQVADVLDGRFGGAASVGVVEAFNAGTGLLIAFLSYGRWRESGALRDLLTCYGVMALAFGNLVFTVAPLVLATRSSWALEATVVAGLCAGLLLAAAALAGDRSAAPSPRRAFDLAMIVLSVSLIAAAFALVIGGAGWMATGSPEDSVAVRAVHVVAAVTFAVAALGFARHVRDDPFAGWMAAATGLWACARVSYAVTGEMWGRSLSAADGLRLLGYLLLGLGAARAIQTYWRRNADLAVLEERRRIARELHDGLAQELAFIAAQSVVISRGHPTSHRVQLLRGAAERALDESRRAIAALTQPLDEPLDIAVSQVAEELGSRLSTRVRLDLEEGIDVDNDVKEALLRIAREAITNAARHGQARRIRVSLENSDGVTLTVSDDGKGFDPHDVAHLAGHVGLVSMRERAEQLGGTLDVNSRPYGGTSVTVHVP